MWFVTGSWATSCCPSLDVSSHSLSLGGSFQRKGSWGDRPIYLDSLNNLFLYFLPMRVGGLWMIGDHCIKTWSATQQAYVLSSAETEL